MPRSPAPAGCTYIYDCMLSLQAIASWARAAVHAVCTCTLARLRMLIIYMPITPHARARAQCATIVLARLKWLSSYYVICRSIY